jgi:hypothetical protein
MEGPGLVHYWVHYFLIAILIHPLLYKYRKRKTFLAFLTSCAVISGFLGAILFGALLIGTRGESELKPGWAVPFVMAGTVFAFPPTFVAGSLFHLIRVCAVRYATRKSVAAKESTSAASSASQGRS